MPAFFPFSSSLSHIYSAFLNNILLFGCDWADRQTDARMEQQTDQQLDGQRDRASYRYIEHQYLLRNLLAHTTPTLLQGSYT